MALLSGVALGGCAYDMYGNSPYNSPYGYGPYSGVSVGLGYGSGYPYGYNDYGYYNPYYYGGFGTPYGGGYGAPYYGWYNDYYYPGTGYYVYDHNRHPRVWSDAEKQYWTQRLEASRSTNGVTRVPNNSQMRAVWDAFNQSQGTTSTTSVTSTSVSRPQRVRSVDRSAVISSSGNRGHWRDRPSVTTTSDDTTTTTRSDSFRHGRGRDRSNDQ